MLETYYENDRENRENREYEELNQMKNKFENEVKPLRYWPPTCSRRDRH